jgi:hypothetical protein
MSDRLLYQVVKGSGMAANLLADIAIFKEAISNEGKGLNPKDKPQSALKSVLEMINKDCLEKRAPKDDAANFDIVAVITTLKEWEGGKKPETDLQRSIDVKLRMLMCETYHIVVRGAVDATAKHLYQYLRKSLEAVSMGLVFVFDLNVSSDVPQDFNEELLKCVHKSIDMSNSSSNSLGIKLKYTMKWGRDELVYEHLKEVLNERIISTDLHEESLAGLTCECMCVCDCVCVCSPARASASTSAGTAEDRVQGSKTGSPRRQDLRLGTQQRSKTKHESDDKKWHVCAMCIWMKHKTHVDVWKDG